MLGDQHLRVVSVRASRPRLAGDSGRPQPPRFAYRWSTRFLCLDKAEAEKNFPPRRQWFAKRKNVIALLRETIFQQESPLVDTDANNKAADADAALQEWQRSSRLRLSDGDRHRHGRGRRRDEAAHGGARHPGSGFVTMPKRSTPWMPGCPRSGNAYANVRQPIVSTLNLAHMMPVSAVWAGREQRHLDGPRDRRAPMARRRSGW